MALTYPEANQPWLSTFPIAAKIAFEYGRLNPSRRGSAGSSRGNPGPFTFKAPAPMSSGEGEVAVIDPGPELEEHIAALVASLAEEQVTHILVTHTHRDHSPAAKALKEATGAPTYGFGPHAGGKRGEAGVEEAATGISRPTSWCATASGSRAASGASRQCTRRVTPRTICALPCPTAAFLFSGDHVMGWSTSVIAPPDGDMAAYMASLDKLLARRDTVFCRPMARRSPSAAACPRLHRASPRARGRHHRLPQGGYRNG